MGTSNFYTKNASKLYPLFTDMEEDEREFFDYDRQCEDVAEFIDESNNKYDSSGIVNETNGYDRNFPERELLTLSHSKWFGDVEIEVNLKVIVRAGYYDGANLDYQVSCDNFEDASYIVIDSYNSDMNAGMCKIQTNNAIAWAEQTQAEMEEYIEAIFAKVTEPYVMIARASNGETFYKKAI